MKQRKVLALLISTLMVLSMIPVMAVTTLAAEIPGNWDTFRGPGDYDPPEEGEEEDEEEFYTPAPGYAYTSEGFVTKAADYTNACPFFSIYSKEPHPVQDGVYMELRVDEFSYTGELGNADEWIAFSIWDQQKGVPGDTKHGSGWTCLIRGNGQGTANFQSFCTTANTEEAPGQFRHCGDAPIEAEMDENGREHYIFSVGFDGTDYTVSVNGVEAPGGQAISDHLKGLSENGDFYIGYTMQAGVQDGVASVSILKFGTSAESASVPTGSDSKEPEPNVNVFAPDMDPSTVPENQPALLWTADKATSCGSVDCQNVVMDAQGDNSWKLTPAENLFFVSFNPKRLNSANVDDFPVCAFLLKDYYGDSGTFYYCSGDNMTASGETLTSWDLYSGKTYGENEEFFLVIVDGTDMYTGRVHGMRIDFNMSGADLADSAFEIKWMGMFRSADEAMAYSDAYMGIDPHETEAPTDVPTEAPTDAPTDAPVETPTEAPTEIVTPGEDQPADTATVTGNATEAVTGEEKKGGCASALGIGSVSGALMVAAAVTLRARKKRRN